MKRTNLDHLCFPTISCVIPTYKRPRSLKRLLDILADQKHTNFDEMDVVVVNDGSHSAEYETVVDEFNPPYKFVYITRDRRPDDRPAFCACVNHAVQHTQGEVVLILDDGLILDDHTLFIHRQYHMLLKNAAIFPHEVYPDRKDELQAPHSFRVSSPPPALIGVFVTVGGNSLRREGWDNVGGLDEDYDGSFGFDDRDMAIRLHRAGVNIVRADGITRLNEDSETGGSWCVKFSTLDDHRNGKIFEEKWPEYKGHNWGVG